MAPASTSIRRAEQAVARIAFLSSDLIVSVVPSLSAGSAFSTQLQSLIKAKSPKSIVSENGVPEILPVRQNNDPLVNVFEPINNGKLVSVLTSSSILIPSVPHLYRLAQFPVVIHVSMQPSSGPDFSEITAIRQSGFSLLHSESLYEAQDMAVTAHGLAIQSGKGVIHFFNASTSAEDEPIELEKRDLIEQILDLRAIQNFHSHPIGGTAIYADEGRRATVTESISDSPSGHFKATNGLVTPGTELPPKTTDSSVGSSERGSSQDSRGTSSSATTVEGTYTRGVKNEDILRMVKGIWSQIRIATSRAYNVFQYTGDVKARTAIFLFGEDSGIYGDAIDEATTDDDYYGAGIITARLYRPWLGAELTAAIPKTVEKIAVLEQVRSRTTKWGPILLDVLTSLRTGPGGPTIVGYQLKHVALDTVTQALAGIFHNLNSSKPVQNLVIGTSDSPKEGLELSQPAIENAYLKVLNQVFGKRLNIANALESAHAGISATVSASPEFGFGSLLARFDKRKKFVERVLKASKSNQFITEAPKQWLSRWALAMDADDVQKADSLAEDVIARLTTDGSSFAGGLLDSKSQFFSESNWLIGSDAWAYDLGNSGVHHVIASGENVNMLIIDSQPYSEHVAADATRRKKDIGLYAMNFGNAYVASVAVYSSYTQLLQALIEADKFNGPSVVLAYLPYNQENESPLNVLQETKKAVDIGYWPLYRWNPIKGEDEEPSFDLDSDRLKRDVEEFLKRDNQLTQVVRRQPKFAANLSQSYGTEVRTVQKRKAKDAYNAMLEGLQGAPLTILFASDNGNAESLSKRLANRGKLRGLKTMAMAMEDYPLEDLANEENIVFLTSTAGQGEFPQNGRPFWDALKDSTDTDLAGVNYSVFALGDSHYWPRKEDKIYYNKPGKDLDAKLAVFGGKRFVEIGLGDDQDPDGYQTGYALWEPKLWQALGVDNVEGLPDEPPPITNEDIKIESNYLRGSIEEGLADTTTGAISAPDQQLTKFHGTYMQDDRDLRDERKAQGLEPAYSFMIRCRLPGGVATPEQWLKMDAISSAHGNETMKLTTRQTFQFHGVIKSKLRPAMRAINKALMTTIAACGDVNRTVMCSSLPAQARYHSEVQAVAQKINDHLLPTTTAYHEIWLQDENDKKIQVAGNAVVDNEPLYGPTYLPRKFKITIAIPPHNDTDVYAHDVGLIAIKGSSGHLEGFNILAGGGMGVTHNNKKTYPRTGSTLGYVTKDQAHIVCEKIMLVQRDNGDRKNRKHARLKYTIDDMGLDVFRGKVEDLLGYKFKPAKPFKFDSNIDTFGWQKDELGLNHFTFFIENGRIEDTVDFQMRTGLREIAKIHTGEFRLTGNQHLILSNVQDKQLPAIKKLMAQYKLDNVKFSGLRLSSSACVAFPTCGLAMAESERYLPKLISKLESCLEENGLRQDSIVMRMTGCPNGCARPWLAEVAFVGKAYGAYNMYLGGGYHGQRINKLYRSSIMEDEILTIMKSLLKRYAQEREPGEHFGDFVIRIGVIKPTTEGKKFHEDVAEEESDEE